MIAAVLVALIFAACAAAGLVRRRARPRPLASRRPCPCCRGVGTVAYATAELFHRDAIEAYSWRRSVEELRARPAKTRGVRVPRAQHPDYA